MIEIKSHNESFIKIIGDDDDILNIKEYFSFYTENYKWNPKYKAGVWDGKIKILQKNGLFDKGLLPRLLKYCKNISLKYTIDNSLITKSIKIEDDFLSKYIENKLKSNLQLRDYQLDAVKYIFKYKRGIVISPTSSGKSFIQYITSMLFLDINKGGKVLIIVPTINLVEQMKNDFIEYAENLDKDLSNDIHTIYSGHEKHLNKQITISTWQSLANMNSSVFKEVDCLIVDEVHTAGSDGNTKEKIISDIINNCTNTQIRFGVSGTLKGTKINNIKLEGLFGKIHQFVTTKELIKSKTISNVSIDIHVLKHPEEIRASLHKQQLFYAHTKDFKKSFSIENQIINESEQRLKYIINTISEIDKNVLILFKNINYGKQIFDILNSMSLGRNIHYIAGSTDSEIREEVRKIANDDKNGIIVASIGVFSTGVNIPSIDCVLFAQSIKSKIKVLQSIGRALRKTKEKNNALIIDIVDNLTYRKKKNYFLKHAVERMEIYESEGFQYKIKEINI